MGCQTEAHGAMRTEEREVIPTFHHGGTSALVVICCDGCTLVNGKHFPDLNKRQASARGTEGVCMRFLGLLSPGIVCYSHYYPA